MIKVKHVINHLISNLCTLTINDFSIKFVLSNGWIRFFVSSHAIDSVMSLLHPNVFSCGKIFAKLFDSLT